LVIFLINIITDVKYKRFFSINDIQMQINVCLPTTIYISQGK